MISEELKEKWEAYRAKGRVLEYLNVEPDQEVYILIDNYRESKGDSHLFCSNVEAMKSFVRNIGGKPRWFQNKYKAHKGHLEPHYDLRGDVRKKALAILHEHIIKKQLVIEFLKDFFPKPVNQTT